MSRRARLFLIGLLVGLFVQVAQAEPTAPTPPEATIGQLAGRVMVRTVDARGVARLEFPKTGRPVGVGQALITGDQSLVELRVGDAGWWRVGRRAVFMLQAEGARLTAGTALVRVPAGAGWRIEAARGAVRLGAGVWLLQAVDNEGLKIICLDGPAAVEALGDREPNPQVNVGANTAVLDRLNLKPGELVFLRPGGAAFGPIVVIYLEEMLATSRLINGFPEPLAELRRLTVLAVIQRNQLKGVTNALVAGAHDDKGFEIAVPKSPVAPPK